MIDIAEGKRYDKAQEIWRTCFGDNEDYTDFLFHRLLRPENVLVSVSKHDDPVAMLCFHPFVLKETGRKTKAAYIFGVATLPEWRNRGLSRDLLQEAQKRLSDQGVGAAALVPAGESLFRFYEKQGYRPEFFAQKITVEAGELPASTVPCTFAPIGVDEWLALRNDFYGDRSSFVQWGRDYLAYIDTETRALGGEILLVVREDGKGFVVCYPYHDALIVKELAVPDAWIGDIVAALHARYSKNEYRVHLPADAATTLPGKIAPFAMINRFVPQREPRPSTGKTPYIAHVLDGPTLGVPLRQVD